MKHLKHLILALAVILAPIQADGVVTNLPPDIHYCKFDSSGNPLNGGKLYTYAANSTTPQATYTDQGGGTANANPVVLGTDGCASVWLNPSLSYKFVQKTSADVTLWTADNVVGLLGNQAVVTASIADGAVTTGKIADANVTAAKLASAVAGDGLAGGAGSALSVNVDGSTIAITADTLGVPTGGIGTTQLAAGAVTLAKLASKTVKTDGTDPGSGGVVFSASTGNLVVTDTSFADVTNLAVTLTTTGRPVRIFTLSDAGTHASYYMATSPATAAIRIIRGASTSVGNFGETSETAMVTGHLYPPNSLDVIDTPAAGTYTYKVQAYRSGGTQMLVRYIKLCAYEL